VDIVFPAGTLGKLISQKTPFMSVRIPFVAKDFTPNSVAKTAGVEKGDTILGINGKVIKYFLEFKNELQSYKDKEVTIMVKRGNDTLNIAMHVPEEGLIGVYPESNLQSFFHVEKRDYSFGEAVAAGFKQTWKGLGDYIKQLKLLFSPEVKAYENVGGFITIGNIFPAQWDWESFWRLTAFLSIMLAILNVLPIPALDGGHVLFLLYEIITRRKPSDKFLEYAQIVGMIILFSLLILANGNDIVKLFR
jgi:regulator of sigma E protease